MTAKSTQNQIGKIYDRPWGHYKTLELADGYQVKILTVNPEGQLSLQKHTKRAEHWVVVSGRPTITIDDNVSEYKVGEAVFIPKESFHRLANFNSEPAVLVEVQIGTYLGEDDIVRVADVYGRVELE